MEAILQEALIEIIETIFNWEFFFRTTYVAIILGLGLRGLKTFIYKGDE